MMWVKTEDNLLLNLDYVRAVKLEEGTNSILRLVAYGDEAAYGGRASSVIIRSFPVTDTQTRAQAEEEAEQSMDLLASSLENVNQMARVVPSRPVAFRKL